MKKDSLKEKFQSRIMDHGVVHLTYCHNGVKDILHPFSVEGYELLSDGFVSFFEKYQPLIPDKAPIVLEFVGKPLTEEEKETVDRTIWTTFCMAMTENDREVKEIWKNSLWYLLFTILSTGLVIAVSSQMNEVVINLAYLPFYFFGYQLLIYLIIDSGPIWAERKWYRRLASMKLVFSEGESRPFTRIDPGAVSREFTGYEKEAEQLIREDSLAEEYLFENGTAVLECRVSCLEDVIQLPTLIGREYISDALSSYLIQGEPFLDGSVPVLLRISGTQFTKEEQESILRAIKNYYGIRIASEEESRKVNGKRILIFGFFLLLTAVALSMYGGVVSMGTHELIIMLLCFWGDYFLESVLITKNEIRENTKRLKRLRELTVVFEN